MSDSHSRRLKRVVIREELVELCGDTLEAVCLEQMLYWGRRVRDADLFLEEEKKRSLENDPETPLLQGWIYKSAEELAGEIMLGERSTVARRLAKLVQRGWLDSRKNPRHKWDKTAQYRVNIVAVQRSLQDIGYALEGYPLLPQPEAKEENPPSTPTVQGEQSSGFSEERAQSPRETPTTQREHSTQHRETSTEQNDQAIPEPTTQPTVELTSPPTSEADFLPRNAQPQPSADPYAAANLLKRGGRGWKIFKGLDDDQKAKAATLINASVDLWEDLAQFLEYPSGNIIKFRAYLQTFCDDLNTLGVKQLHAKIRRILKDADKNPFRFYDNFDEYTAHKTDRAASSDHSERDVKESTNPHDEVVDMAELMANLPSEGTWGRRR